MSRRQFRLSAKNQGGTLVTGDQWQLIAAVLLLSGRELQIVQGIFAGEPEATIATSLGISGHTVHTYLGRLYRKLGVHDRSELIVEVFAAYVLVVPRVTELPPVSTHQKGCSPHGLCPLCRRRLDR
jgi:DNA-binding CsgD family transcriptional regulator